jgi:hypothetical protein
VWLHCDPPSKSGTVFEVDFSFFRAVTNNHLISRYYKIYAVDNASSYMPRHSSCVVCPTSRVFCLLASPYLTIPKLC